VSDEPPYRVYRARPKLLARGDLGTERRGATPPRPRRRVTSGRVARWLVLGLIAWLAISVLAFLTSSLLQGDGVSDAAQAELAGGSAGLLEPATVLLLGSDARSAATAEPGSEGLSSRADSIMLMRVGGGASARLSIPRDTLAEIPGRGRDKINAAYAQGGVALMVQAVEGLLGVQVDHAMLIDFERFPGLIDAMGGIDYTGGCVVSRINGGARNGGVTLRLPAGTNHLTGKQALALARTRTNACRPNEDDRARARRQQKIVGAMRSRVLSPAGFVRLPRIAWATPRALRTDMGGPTLMGFALGAVVSGDADSRVLPVNADPGGGTGLVVDEARKARAVERFLAG
jgi:LCP family protein required for cell wall assembly